MNVTDSEQRRSEILQLVIEAHVLSGEPVGSAFIAKRLRSSLSSATIRNVMAELEEQGFLEQPHTSAGRVPTDKGYRYYVDAIMQEHRLSPEQVQELERLIPVDHIEEIDQLMERTSEVLSILTQQAGFVVAPTVKRSTVKQIELVPLGVRKVLCVLVAPEEIVTSHVVEIGEPMTQDEVAALGRFLNTELVGMPFDALLESLERRLLAEADSFYHLVKRSLVILQHALATEPVDRLFLEGSSYVLAQPEIQASERVRELFRCLESGDELLECLRQDIGLEGVRVRIGHEIRLPAFLECSYVTAPFAIGRTVIGGVGVLGSKRMDYPRVSSFVDGAAHLISEALTHWEAR